MSETKFGTLEELLAITEEKLRPVILELRNIILEVDPNAVEVVRLGDRAATYGIGPQKMKEGYAYILPHTKWVNLGFFRGSMLKDPTHLLAGTGKNMRHVNIYSIEDANKEGIKKLIQHALQERIETLQK